MHFIGKNWQIQLLPAKQLPRLMFRSEVLHWSLCSFSITLVLTIGGISLCGQKYKTIRLISNLIKQIICCHLIVVLRQVIWTTVAANLIWIRSIKCGKLLTVSNQIGKASGFMSSNSCTRQSSLRFTEQKGPVQCTVYIDNYFTTPLQKFLWGFWSLF